MKKISKKSYEGVCKKVAFLSIVSLLLNVSMIGVFFSAPEAQGAPIENEELCEVAVDVVLIMDRSGSMGWEIPTRISQAKNAANDFLGNLGAEDQSAVVSYASEVTLNKELSGDHSATQTAVSSLRAKGGTNIGDAIYLSNQELGSARTNPQAVKTAILLTDGRATCPYYDSSMYGMCGFVEDDEDIAYTLDAASIAADLGYKIFTIGLGEQYKINEEMLREVAEITGAEYYHAPNSEDLESIYESIRWQLCEYGSISGCKYNDIDNDGDNEDFIAEDTISDWEIILTGETNGPITQLTDENGCYQFSGLLPGSYIVSEGGKDGTTDFIQTYPQDPSLSYDITLGNEENLTGYDFGNYFPLCGNEILDGDFGESCDDGNNTDGDGCSSECLLEDNFVCGNGVKEGDEECDGSDGVGDHQICANCELINLTYCGDGIQQTPNDKGTGGPLNNGNEECDGESGVDANQTCSASCVLLESLCRVKLDTVVIVDRSGSMGWEIPTRLNQAKIAANSFVGKLGSDDRSALVSFSTTANLNKTFSNDHSATQTAINSLIASGATNIGDAIGLANDEFLSSAEDVLKIEILLTDGLANKPNGDGFNENPADVAYAVEKAAKAALSGIKIFTIGLGSDINEIMLQNIATDTGAQYYNAPTADELEEIFSEIAYDICQYGSISGCKYEDSNNDGEIVGELTLSNWEINLTGDANLTQLTNDDGCYSFTGLSGGNYTVSEGSEQGVDFIQTYPQALSYDIILEDREEVVGYDFGNYFPVCGNDILDTGEECDDGNVLDGDGCSSSCNIENCGGGDDGSSDPVAILLGDIVINEIMQNPDVVSDANGEWFELYNTTDSDINLEGCTISDNGSDSHIIGELLTIPANGYAVLAKNVDPLINDGITPDYVYGFTLGNTDDEIILVCGSIEIDKVEYDGGPEFPDPAGASMILNDPLNNNNIGTNWCVSTSSYSNDNLGTPGIQNDSCGGGGSACVDSDGDGVCDDTDNCPDIPNPNQEDTDTDGVGDACEITDSQCIDNDGDGYGTGDTTNCPNSEIDCNDENVDIYPGAVEICDDGIDNDCDLAIDCDDGDCDEDLACGGGESLIVPDVIINEVAWMGTIVSTDDEWIELRNMTGEAILLDNWTLNAQDDTPSITLEGSIPANGYYLLERSNEDTVPDIMADKIYTGALGNPGEFLELRKADSTLVDEVDGSANWPAGNAESKYPMERCADDSWYDSDVVGGTPKAENGCGGACADSDGDGVCNSTDNCPNTPNPNQEDTDTDGVGDACEIIDSVCVDNDNDGYGTGDTTNCPNSEIDCNDNDESVNPGMAEICDDQVDNNCNEEVDEGCGDGDSINAGEVIINELMWMGSSKNADDQWVELKNVSGKTLNLKGCQLKYKSNSGNENKLAYLPDDVDLIFNPDSYYLISHYTKSYSRIDVEPDFGGTSNVNNFDLDNLQVKLYCGGDLIDTADDGIGNPLAGEYDEGVVWKSMSRKAISGNGELAENWYTASTADNWDAGVAELGTPGSENSM